MTRVRVNLSEARRRLAAEGIDPERVGTFDMAWWSENLPYREGVRSALITPHLIVRNDGSGVLIEAKGGPDGDRILTSVLIGLAHAGTEDRRWLFVELFPEVIDGDISLVEIRLRAIAALGWDGYTTRLKEYYKPSET